MKKKRKSRQVYSKPVFIKQEKMTFTREIMNSIGCNQCSGCHGCRG